MNSKSGAIPKKRQSGRRMTRLPSSDSDSDFDKNKSFMSARRTSNRVTGSPKPSSSELDNFVNDDSFHDDVSATTTSNIATSKITNDVTFMRDIIELDEAIDLELAELNEMISKYESGSGLGKKPEGSLPASEIGKAALIVANNKAKSTKSKVVDLRNKASKQTLQKCETVDLTTKTVSVRPPLLKTSHTVTTQITLKRDNASENKSGKATNSFANQTTSTGTAKRAIADHSRTLYGTRSQTSTSRAVSTIKSSIGSAQTTIRATNKRAASQTSTSVTSHQSNSTTVPKKPKATISLAVSTIRSINKLSMNPTSTLRTGSTKRSYLKESTHKPAAPKRVPKASLAVPTAARNIVTSAPSPGLMDGCHSPLFQTPSKAIKNIATTPITGVILECPVCFERLLLGRPTVLTTCGHMFCRSCMNEIQSHPTNKVCPICRAELAQVIDVRV